MTELELGVEITELGPEYADRINQIYKENVWLPRDKQGFSPCLSRGSQITFEMKAGTTLPADIPLVAGAQPEKPFALFTISDTGPGIPSDAIDQIWEPRFTTKGAKGTVSDGHAPLICPVPDA